MPSCLPFAFPEHVASATGPMLLGSDAGLNRSGWKLSYLELLEALDWSKQTVFKSCLSFPQLCDRSTKLPLPLFSFWGPEARPQPLMHPQEPVGAERGGGYEIHAPGGDKVCVPVLGRAAHRPGSWGRHSLSLHKSSQDQLGEFPPGRPRPSLPRRGPQPYIFRTE